MLNLVAQFIRRHGAWSGAGGLGLLLAGFLAALHWTGFLEALELTAYDVLVGWQAKTPASDPRISLVTITDDDLARLQAPSVPDRVLAELLEKIAGSGPRVIGIDLYRDMPIGDGKADLDAVLNRHSEIVVVRQYGSKLSGGIAAPAAVTDESRIGCTDIPLDPDGRVRRLLLFVGETAPPCYGLGLGLALAYLAADGIFPEPDPTTPDALRLNGTTLWLLGEHLGGYTKAILGGYQILPDFRQSPAAFPRFRLMDVLNRRVDAANFRDRIILIGTDAESVKDHFSTPIASHIAGVALHALTADQVLRSAVRGEGPIRALPDEYGLAWLYFWCGAGLVIGARDLSLAAFILALSLGTLGNGAGAYAALANRWWLPVVPAEMALVSAATLQGLLRARRERAVRQMLMQLFGRHVDRRVAEAIWRERDALLSGRRLAAQKTTATVLFSDLVGFSTQAELLEPEVFVAWLNDYLDAMTRIIAAHNGVTIRFIGDAILAGFGVPVTRTDPKTREDESREANCAARCAIAMAAELRCLNKSWAARGLPTAGVRIGINTGELMAGSIGSAERLEYTIHGDTVNIAARLETWEKEGFSPSVEDSFARILISAKTERYLEDSVVRRLLGEVALRGKRNLTQIYQLQEEASDPEPAATPQSPRSLPH